MLASATDLGGVEVTETSRTLITVIFGAVRNAFERDRPHEVSEDLRRDLVNMCRAYLKAEKSQSLLVTGGKDLQTSTAMANMVVSLSLPRSN